MVLWVGTDAATEVLQALYGRDTLYDLKTDEVRSRTLPFSLFTHAPTMSHARVSPHAIPIIIFSLPLTFTLHTPGLVQINRGTESLTLLYSSRSNDAIRSSPARYGR